MATGVNVLKRFLLGWKCPAEPNALAYYAQSVNYARITNLANAWVTPKDINYAQNINHAKRIKYAQSKNYAKNFNFAKRINYAQIIYYAQKHKLRPKH